MYVKHNNLIDERWLRLLLWIDLKLFNLSANTLLGYYKALSMIAYKNRNVLQLYKDCSRMATTLHFPYPRTFTLIFFLETDRFLFYPRSFYSNLIVWGLTFYLLTDNVDKSFWLIIDSYSLLSFFMVGKSICLVFIFLILVDILTINNFTFCFFE